MYIEAVQLENFRNYEALSLSFSPSVNVIYGKNGQGKTNLLEAMFLCAVGKSFRTPHDSEMIRYKEDSFSVGIQIEENLFGKISVKYDRKKAKIICIDGVCIPKMRFLMGKLVGVMFSPEDLRLVSDGPSERRKFLDMAICQLGAGYYHALLMYNKAVKEKNALLSEAYRKPVDSISLAVYNETMAEYGSYITYERFCFLDRLASYAAERHRFITEENEELLIRYQPSCAFFKEDAQSHDGVSRDALRESLYAQLSSAETAVREKERGRCLVGPHRDDFDFLLKNISLKQYGSQGQKRTAVVAVKLAELSIMQKITGRIPVLFLDDVMSELDLTRKGKLIECLEGVQTFITCTDRDVAGDFEKATGKVRYINAETLR